MNNQTKEMNELSFEEYFNYLTKNWRHAGFTDWQISLVKLLCESFEVRGQRKALKKNNNRKLIK